MEENIEFGGVMNAGQLTWKHIDRALTLLEIASTLEELHRGDQCLLFLARVLLIDDKYETDLAELNKKHTEKLDGLSEAKKETMAFEHKLEYELEHFDLICALMNRRGYYPHIPEDALIIDPYKEATGEDL